MVQARRGTVSNYNLERDLGSGGQGQVFLGTPMDNDEPHVAVKFCPNPKNGDNEA